MKEFQLSEGTSEIAPGWSVTIKQLNPVDRTIPGSTARHEALHTVAAILNNTHVKEASKIPGPGYLGRTILGQFDGLSFVAAHAFGCSGTGHDRAVLVMLGHSPEVLASSARSLLSGHEDEIQAVSSLIESKGTISGYEAKDAMGRAANPEVDIYLFGPEGEKRHFVTRVRKSEGYIIPLDIAA